MATNTIALKPRRPASIGFAFSCAGMDAKGRCSTHRMMGSSAEVRQFLSMLASARMVSISFIPHLYKKNSKLCSTGAD